MHLTIESSPSFPNLGAKLVCVEEGVTKHRAVVFSLAGEELRAQVPERIFDEDETVLHLWISEEDDRLRVGLSPFAQGEPYKKHPGFCHAGFVGPQGVVV